MSNGALNIASFIIKGGIAAQEWSTQNKISPTVQEEGVSMARTISTALAAAETWNLHHNIPDHHGSSHIQQVLLHGLAAIEETLLSVPLTRQEQLAIILACIGHDLDDRKFVSNDSYAGVRYMLEHCGITETELVRMTIDMVKLVSCSQNGNDIDETVPKWYYIPRSCDRLEALGSIGIKRVYETTLEFNKRGGSIPIWSDKTDICTTQEELDRVATIDRLARYRERGGKSDSLIDHFYDKLLHISKLYDGTTVLQEIANKRHQIMVDFVLEFGKTGNIDWSQW